jgi:formylglycine-generating enzyme required for sulfatase activity
MTQVFLSHSTKDADFAQQMADDLRAAGVPVWKAPESIRPGEGWVEALEYGLRTSTHMLLLMSPAAVASKWVNWEVDLAMMLHARGQIVILPVDYLPCDPPLRWQRFQSISGIDDEYHSTLFGLLKQLRAERPQKPPAPAEPGTTINIHVEGDVSGVGDVAEQDVTYAGRPEEPPSVSRVSKARQEKPSEWSIDAAATYRDAVKAYQEKDFKKAVRLADILTDDAPEFLPELVEDLVVDVANALEREARYREYLHEYQQVAVLARENLTIDEARQLWLKLRQNYPGINDDPDNLTTLIFSSINNVLPPPFEWVEITAGQVTTTTKTGALRNYNVGSGTSVVDHFMIAKYPVTNAQFQVFVRANNGYQNPRWWNYSGQAEQWRRYNTQPQESEWGGPPDHPRVNVTWFEAVAFCWWLSELVGYEVRLPSEQEWLRAAQGDDGRKYPWGDQEPDYQLANSANNIGRTTPVDSYLRGASPYGVLDMAGNVYEWCSTDLQTGSYSISLAAERRVLLGCSWDTYIIFENFRDSHYPYLSSNNSGFRLARSL